MAMWLRKLIYRQPNKLLEGIGMTDTSGAAVGEALLPFYYYQGFFATCKIVLACEATWNNHATYTSSIGIHLLYTKSTIRVSKIETPR
jgi:hypothetical protein